MGTITLTTKDKIAIALTDIDDEIFLDAIYNIVNKVKVEKEVTHITDERWNVINERRRKYLSGEEKAFTPEEVRAQIAAKYGI